MRFGSTWPRRRAESAMIATSRVPRSRDARSRISSGSSIGIPARPDWPVRHQPRTDQTGTARPRAITLDGGERRDLLRERGELPAQQPSTRDDG